MYSQADIERWVIQNAKKRQLLSRRLGGSWRTATDAQVLSLLSLAIEGEGFTQVALGNRTVAMNHFGESVAINAKLLDMGIRRINRADGYVRTGYFQTLLIAWAIEDDRLISEFAALLQVDGIAAELSPPDSTYIARALKALSVGRPEDGKNILGEPMPDMDVQFKGYFDCLKAITEGEWNEFESALQLAADSWERFVKKDCAGQPQSVCFMGGLGLLKLAKRYGLKRTTLDVDQIPTFMQ